jgi:hypothetical protein
MGKGGGEITRINVLSGNLTVKKKSVCVCVRVRVCVCVCECVFVIEKESGSVCEREIEGKKERGRYRIKCV